jgi:hypothetical protein
MPAATCANLLPWTSDRWCAMRPKPSFVRSGRLCLWRISKLRGLFDLPSLSTALVVLTRLDDSPLADHHRDLLWQAFRVPVFEQVRGWDGTVIARECEVHDGLHVAESSVIPQLDNDELLITKADTSEECLVPIRTGFAAEIITGHCDCGTETPRLRNLMQAGRQTAALIGGDRAAMR